MTKTVNSIAIALVVCVVTTLTADRADATVLYDGSLGTLPSAQGFFYQDLPGGIVPVAVGGATTLDTTPLGDVSMSGFFRLSPVPLDSSLGYVLSFSVDIRAESHTNSERAGFSVIAVGSNVAPGVPSSIEIGFQDGRVFSQNDTPLFGNPAAESSAFDPVGVGFVDYDLVVLGSSYELFADNTSILAGSLRDYTAFAGILDPYETPNFIFFGDNTTSAQANINFRSAEVNAVPEPSTAVGLLALGTLAGIGCFVRRRRSSAKLR